MKASLTVLALLGVVALAAAEQGHLRAGARPNTAVLLDDEAGVMVPRYTFQGATTDLKDDPCLTPCSECPTSAVSEVKVQLEWLSISQIAAQLSQLPEVVVRQLETALRTSRDLELSIGVRLGIDDTGRLSSLLIHQVRTSAGTLYQALSVCTCMLETPDACKAGAAQRRHCPGAGVCPMAAHRCVPEPQVPTNAGSRFAPLRCGLCGACARCCRRSCSLRTAAVDKSCVVSGCKGLGCAERREFGTLAGGGHRQGVADDWKR